MDFLSSTTINEVILFVCITDKASAASVPGCVVLQFTVITSAIGVLWISTCLFKVRLISPSVYTPTNSSLWLTTQVIPNLLAVTSSNASLMQVAAFTLGIASPVCQL